MRHLLLLLLAAQPLYAADFADPRALVEAALAAHPSMERLRAEAAAARERITPAASQPNPMLMGGIEDKQIDLRDDAMMTMYMVGASQTLVRPERLRARRNAAELEARALERQLDSLRAEIERDVVVAWYDLAAADTQLRTTAQAREMIDAVVAASRVRYEVGTSVQADVIRAQLQLSELDREIVRLRGVRRAALARLLPLLGLDTATNVPPVSIPASARELELDGPVAPPAAHPAIAALELEVARQEEVIRLARLETKPDVDLEVSYGHRRMERDMFSIVARVELPLRRESRIEPRVREAIALRDAARARTAELRRDLTRELALAAAAHDEAEEQMKLHEEVLVPQARLAFDSTLAAYQTGRASFDAILATETAYLRLQLQYYDFLARHAQAAVNYEALRRGARASTMSPAAVAASPMPASTGTSTMSGMQP